jgi:hypothetical protein
MVERKNNQYSTLNAQCSIHAGLLRIEHGKLSVEYSGREKKQSIFNSQCSMYNMLVIENLAWNIDTLNNVSVTSGRNPDFATRLFF